MFTICGGKKLCGKLDLPTAKNSILPIMAASMLCTGEVILNDCPHISDVDVSIQILKALGCKASFVGKNIHINADNVEYTAIPSALMGAMRSSVFYLAPLLVRMGKVKFHTPGGCRLGIRPIDIHLDGLQHLGATITNYDDSTEIAAPNGLYGGDYTLRVPSVGATETLMMAAVKSRGDTVLRGAATEPEICDLAAFLNANGAKIKGAGTGVIQISPTKELGYSKPHTLNKDRITAATVLFAVAAVGGDVTVCGGDTQHYRATLRVLKDMGCELDIKNDSVHIFSDKRLIAQKHIYTDVYPAFCTDAAPLAAAALLTAQGESNVIDTIFENRFVCTSGFADLGANAVRNGRALCIQGARLYGADLEAPDLRGGAALAIAAMCADGESTLKGISHIKRGYEDFAGMFAGLGARIKLKSS